MSFTSVVQRPFEPEVEADHGYADEHYVPTLLAYLGKDQETDCWGFMVNVDWSRGGAHPRTYAVEDIDVDM